jgi:hypothetical protein
MNKKLIAIAVAGVMAAPMAAQAADVSGFADILYTSTNDGDTTQESLFTANGEVDVMAKTGDVSVRLDANVTDTGTGLEQAFFSAPMGMVTLIGGKFNTPLTADGYDRPQRTFTTHSAVYNVAKNVATEDMYGLALAGMAGPANWTLAFVNDPGSNGTDNTNSAALVVGGTIMDGLDAELGYFSQNDDTAKYTGTSAGSTLTANPGAGNITDINFQYTGVDMLTVGLDYATAANVVDSVYSIDAGYDFGNGFSAAVRYDSVSFDSSTGFDDPTATSVSLGYEINDNLSVTLENTSGSTNDANGSTPVKVTEIADGSLTTLEFLGTF